MSKFYLNRPSGVIHVLFLRCNLCSSFDKPSIKYVYMRRRDGEEWGKRCHYKLVSVGSTFMLIGGGCELIGVSFLLIIL